ncbi:hypothetical protein F4804DRAFT_323641 [Jackrogersella minutella]|nr:hypothetical protein F4804DRAFT_323641 [Jackrogersella minutella]
MNLLLGVIIYCLALHNLQGTTPTIQREVQICRLQEYIALFLHALQYRARRLDAHHSKAFGPHLSIRLWNNSCLTRVRRSRTTNISASKPQASEIPCFHASHPYIIFPLAINSIHFNLGALYLHLRGSWKPEVISRVF